MSSYFDSKEGRWVTPEYEIIGDTGANLKTVIASLATDKPDYDGVDQLFYKYFVLIRHGETTHTHKTVEWFLNESVTGTVTVSFKDGSTWEDDCYCDEIPMWLLLSILRAIQRRKPLGDLEADYVRTKREESFRSIKLTTRPTFFTEES
jgi:hypothetical protein